MSYRQSIVPAVLIASFLSGCSHNASTLAENDPFQGKDPFQEVASQESAGNTRVASSETVPPPSPTQWTRAEGWRTASHVTHPEFVSDPIPASTNPQVAASEQPFHSSPTPGSAIRNTEYVAARPVSTEARIQVVSAEGIETDPRPKISVKDGIRFIDIASETPALPEFVDEAPTTSLSKEIPPFVEEPSDVGVQMSFGDNPFESDSASRGTPATTPPQNAPEWWEN